MRVALKHPTVHLLLLEKITDFDLAIPVLLVGFLVDAGFGFYEPKQEPTLAQHLSFVAECPASSVSDASLAALVEGTTGPPSGPHLKVPSARLLVLEADLSQTPLARRSDLEILLVPAASPA